jgi:hypothetical protein
MMKKTNLAAIFVSEILSLSLNANVMTIQIDKSGFLINSNRCALATFSDCTLRAIDSDGKIQLPCCFSYRPCIGGDRSRQIVFSSVNTESVLSSEKKLECLSGMGDADKQHPMPKCLKIGILNLEMEDDPRDIILTVREKENYGNCNGCDLLLYRRLPEVYFRYFRSSDNDRDYWMVNVLGTRIDYRIHPVDVFRDDFLVEYTDIKSRFFSKIQLRYVKVNDDFCLKRIILSGDHMYQADPLKSDPAASEVKSMFVKSNSCKIKGDARGVVENGYGILKSKRKLTYNVFRQDDKEKFKVEIDIP